MQSKSKSNFKKNIANFFGALGYLFVSLQWLVIIMVYSGVMMEFLSGFAGPEREPVVTPVSTATSVVGAGVNMPMLIIGGIVVVVMVLVSIYVFVKIPSTIVKTGHKVTQKAAEHTTPLVLKLRHKKDTKKNRNFLTPLIIVIIKGVIIAVPVILSYTSQSLEDQALDYHVTMYLGLWLAGFSVVCFGLQYLMAKLLAVKIPELK